MSAKATMRCLVVFLAGLTTVCRSQPVSTYNTPVDWNNAVTAPVAINFENIVPANETSPWYQTMTIGGVRFDVPNSPPTILMVLGTGYFERPNAQLSSQGLGWASALTVTFPTAVRGAAFSLWGFGNAQVTSPPYQYDFTLDTGGSASTMQNGMSQPSTFLGLVSETPFTAVTISSPVSIINLDYVSYAVTVPEPGMPALLTLASAAIMLCRRHVPE